MLKLVIINLFVVIFKENSEHHFQKGRSMQHGGNDLGALTTLGAALLRCGRVHFTTY